MAEYRIFFIGPDKHITSVQVVINSDDLEVMETAKRVLGSHPAVEVWERARIVGRVDALAVTSDHG